MTSTSQAALKVQCRCPGFSWDRVNFHEKPAGLTQTSQSDGRFYTKWHHAGYLSGGAACSRVICYSGASWALGGENIACCVFVLPVLLLLFASPFTVLLKCFYPNPWVLAFPVDSPLHLTRWGKEGESNCVVLCCQLGLNHDSRQQYHVRQKYFTNRIFCFLVYKLQGEQECICEMYMIHYSFHRVLDSRKSKWLSPSVSRKEMLFLEVWQSKYANQNSCLWWGCGCWSFFSIKSLHVLLVQKNRISSLFALFVRFQGGKQSHQQTSALSSPTHPLILFLNLFLSLWFSPLLLSL